MFPEIVRDDIFRLETRRLWLRWPTNSDMDASARTAATGDAIDKTAIKTWRSEMERGSALHFVLVLKGNEREALGTVHISEAGGGRLALRYSLDTAWHGGGLMTEAVQSAIDAAFLLGASDEIGASPTVLDSGGRRVLERCGFTYLGNGMREGRFGKGLVACDHFRLERKTWNSLKDWRFRVPSLPAMRSPTLDPVSCASA